MKKLFFMVVCLIIITGCGKNDSNEKVVNVLNWSSYIPDSVIHDFEKEYSIRVNYGTYSSNEELLAKITSSKSGTYDVIFPSDYMVELMRERDLIQVLDKNKLYNLGNINTLFLNQSYDYNNNYSIPFLSTKVVIVVNRDHVYDNISSYNDLLDSKYKNNIVLIDDQRIVIGMALMALGYDMNDTDEYHLREAEKWLLRLKNNIKAYDSDSPKTFFMTDEVDLGVMWSAEAEIAKNSNPNIEIIDAIDGHAISTDNYAIVKGARNIDNAYLFINYLMRKDVSRKIVEEYPYVSPININQVSNMSIGSVFYNGYYVKNIGSAIKSYDKLWADVK